VRHDPSGAVYNTRLPGAYEIAQVKQAVDQVAMLGSTGSEKPAATKDLAMAKAVQCVDLEANRQEVAAIAMPDGAATIDSLTFELTDDSGNPIDQPLTDISVTELASLQVRLLAHCTDADGAAMAPVPLPGAELALQVADLDPAFTRGVVSGDTTCPSAIISTAGELTPVAVEVGTRSIFTSLDGAGAAQFGVVELIAASTAIKTKNADGVWLVLAADSVVEVAPGTGSPAQISWIGSPDHTMPQSFLSVYEEQAGPLTQYTQYVNGPRFYLLDTYGNAVALWGAGDTDSWHRDPSGEIYIPSPGAWGSPPWAAVVFEPESSPVFYRLWQFCSEPYPFGSSPSTVYTGFQQWQVCADPGDGGAPICSTFSLDNSQSMNWIYTQWPFLTDDINTGAGGEVLDHYVDGAEWSDPLSWTTSPGQPLLFQPSGKPVLLRIDPATTDDQYSPHSDTFDNVPVRVWVSGPVSEPGSIRLGRESPDDPYEPIKAEDVEICVGTLTYSQGGEYPLIGTCDQKFVGEANFDAFTDPGPDGMFDGQLFSAAFGISKAPREPGIYTIVIETDDPRFSEYSQITKDWNYFGRWHYSFEVVSSYILNEEWQVIDDCIHVVGEEPVYFLTNMIDAGQTVSLVAATVSEDGSSNNYPLIAERITTDSRGLSSYVCMIVLSQDLEKLSAVHKSSHLFPTTAIDIGSEFHGQINFSFPEKTNNSALASKKLIGYRVNIVRAAGIFKEDGSYEPRYVSQDNDGRVYINWKHDTVTPTNITWEKDSQYVDFRVSVTPIDTENPLPDNIRIRWKAIDPDDPSNTKTLINDYTFADKFGKIIDPNDYDPSGVPLSEPAGNDNLGDADGKTTWEQVPDYDMLLVGGADENDRAAEVATNIKHGGSEVRLNLTDAGGDNFIVSTELFDINSPNIVGSKAETGIFTMWKHINLEYVKMHDADHLPIDGILNVFKDYVYIDFSLLFRDNVDNVYIMGTDSLSALGRLDDYATSDPLLGEFSNEGKGWFFIAAALEFTPMVIQGAIPIYSGTASIVDDSSLLLQGPLDPGTPYTVRIYHGSSSNMALFIVDDASVTPNRTGFSIVKPVIQPVDDPTDLAPLDLQAYGFPINSVWNVEIKTRGDYGTYGISLAFDFPSDLRFIGRCAIFTKYFPESIQMSIHELVHSLGFAHRCGNMDFIDEHSCAMNYAVDFILDDSGVPIPWSNHNLGNNLCAEHVRAIRIADLSDDSSGRRLGW
jgi:hypothetical protein